MITMNDLKKLVEADGKKESLPKAKTLRESAIPVIARKCMENKNGILELLVYKNGYVLYRIGKRTAVFRIGDEDGYSYASVMDGVSKASSEVSREEWEQDLTEDFFGQKEWYWKLILIGEDILAHNLAKRDRGRCFSYNDIAEDTAFMEDTKEPFEETVEREEMGRAMLNVLNPKQQKIIYEIYWEQLTQQQVADRNGMGRTSVTNMLKRSLNKLAENFNGEEEQNNKKIKKR